ncbi:MAG: DUF3310 domain-containing protein [Sandaracinaceae bacterium]|nr:DUF3310 domain-containing protein [Sandaracinaceae bacterium]
MSDNVNNPGHYKRGGIEVIDVIEALEFDFHDANAFKYLARAGHKKPDWVTGPMSPDVLAVEIEIAITEKEIEDRSKSIWYQNRKLEAKRRLLQSLHARRNSEISLREKIATPEGFREAVAEAKVAHTQPMPTVNQRRAALGLEPLTAPDPWASPTLSTYPDGKL